MTWYDGLKAISIGLFFLGASHTGEASAREAALYETVRLGDRLKVLFFERMDVTDELPGPGDIRPDAAPTLVQGVFPRTDVSGEYQVERTGTITLPIFGTAVAGGRSTAELTSALQELFGRVFHRPCYVTVSISQRAPVFVLGAVRTAGSFPYSPGLTVLQTLSLAGGTSDNDRSTEIELTREQERKNATLERLRHAVAQRQVLTSRRTGTPVSSAPPELVALGGMQDFIAVLNAEKGLLDLRAQQGSDARAALESAVQAATIELDLVKQRATTYDSQVSARAERVRTMEGLFARQVVEHERMADVRRDYFDMVARRKEVDIAIHQAEERFAAASRRLATHDLTVRFEAEQTLMRVQQEAEGLASEVAAHDRVIRLLSGVDGRAQSTGLALSFEVVRIGSSGTETIQATETDTLEPGDVLRVTRYQPLVNSAPRVAEK